MGVFRDWIDSQGGPRKVAHMLGSDSSLVSNWLSRVAIPRPLTMREIVKRSKGRVTYDDIIDETMPKKSAKANQKG